MSAQPEAGAPRGTGLYLGLAASIVVVATLAAAIGVMGTPAQQRLVRLDERRIGDLDRIVRAIREHGLPPDLATLARTPGERLSIIDPVDGQPYEFAPLGKDRYRLCARFATDSAKVPSVAWHQRSWNHGEGRHCYERDLKGNSAAAQGLSDVGPDAVLD
jgi:hypothetical protein